MQKRPNTTWNALPSSLVTRLNTNDPLPPIVVLELSLKIERKLPGRQSKCVRETNRTSISLETQREEPGDWSLRVLTWGGEKKHFPQEINEVGLALEWKSGYELRVTLNYSSLFTTYVICAWRMTLNKLSCHYRVWYMVNDVCNMHCLLYIPK